MVVNDIVLSCKTGNKGIIITLNKEYAEVVWLKTGMYNPEICNINDLEVVNNEN